MFKEWNCATQVFRNKAIPECAGYTGSMTLQVREFDLNGDATEDGEVNAEDVLRLQRYLSGGGTSHISADNSDLNDDAGMNIFDLCLLKKKLQAGETEDKPVISVDYVEENTAAWRISDGIGGRTVTFNIEAEAGSTVNIGWGYWDGSYVNDNGTTGKLLQNSAGDFNLDENGKTAVTVEVPEGMRRVMLEIYSYSKDGGTLDKDGVELVKVVTQ